MKRNGSGKRLIALVLALTMFVSLVPSVANRALAAKAGDTFAGNTGLKGNINTQDTISWPIKIYDYLNDGMLFEYSSAQDTEVWPHTGGSYGGGRPMPMIGENVLGQDYTSVVGYFNETPYYNSYGGIYDYDYDEENYAFTHWGNRSAYSCRFDANATEAERSINQPVKDKSPMSLHFTYVGDESSKSYGWVSNFAKDEGKYYSKEDIRYFVIVYKTNAAYAELSNGVGHALRPYWAVSENAYSSSADISDVHSSLGWSADSFTNPTGTLVAEEVRLAPSTDTWTYQIFDMKTDLQSGCYSEAQPMSENNYGIKTNWSKIGDERIAGVGMSIPICLQGEEMDISHIAYFGSEFEANEFGQDCVEFNNDPGEYLGYEISMTHTVTGGSASATASAPTGATGNGWDFTKSGNSSWSDSTFTSWANGYGMTTSKKNDYTSGGHYYTRVSNTDLELDTAYVWTGATANVADNQYIAIVYRTNISSPKLGFWLERSGTYAGKGFNGTSYTDKRVSITKSTSDWQVLVYDLSQINNWDSDYNSYFKGKTFNSIGIMFPGFTSSSQYMDIAYVDFFSSSSKASTFGNAAKNYLNSFEMSNANNVNTDVSKSSSVVGGEMWNMGSNQAFTFLYASTGGGWMDSDSNSDTGGVNNWTNGYYSYPIGNVYLNPNGTSNDQRTAATGLGKNYRVSSSIFLLNTYDDLDSSIPGVNYDTDSDGEQIDKQVDMSYLPLGYTLYNVMKGEGVMTAGLLQSSLTSFVGVDGKEYKVMQYKDDTVHYLATLLRDTLVIPQRDFWGYNYNYVMGSESVEYYEDWDGDGKLDTAFEDVDNDGKLDTVKEDRNNNGVLDKSEDLDFDSNLDIYEDLDYDGFLDPAEDIDGDGHFDKFEDLNYNGILDPGEDWDNDGKLDLIEDLNENGELDEGEDRNGNGKLDLVEDVNENGILDKSEDLDGDGKLDLIEDLNHNGQFDEGEDLNGNGKFDLTEDVNDNKALDPGEDVDGDGKLDVNEDIDGDGHKDIDERTLGNGDDKLDKRDLATALRERLGVKFDYDSILADANGNGQPDNAQQGTYSAKLGSYSDTISRVVTTDANGKKVNGLIGPYLQCADNIKTFYDAAYYLLHNLFVDNSYNQVEDDYKYLVMSKGTVVGGARDGSNKDAYVFDAGFTYSDGAIGTVYDEVKKTISQATAEGKWGIYYTDYHDTTLHPFLPINDEGEDRTSEFRATGTPYFREDGAASVKAVGDTYAGRNYNYVMAANGEFVYHADDDLFFQFQGDDDVYMFVNGELVLDIGAAHSITDVSFYMNDYVNVASQVLSSLEGYMPEMSDEDFAKVLKSNGITSSYTYGGKSYDIAALNRLHKLNLVDGHAYAIDFYYMERHGWGANMRIATNIVMTDPTLTTDKNAYQGMDSNGNYTEIDYGGLVDEASPINYEFAISNEGNTKLYKLSFKDPSIGVDLTYEDGLLVYGKPTVVNFTTTSDTTLGVTNLEGAFNLDGKVYFTSTDGTLSWEENGETKTAMALAITHDQNNTESNTHTLTLYQLNRNTLFTDQMAAIRLGGDTGGTASQNATTGVYTINQGRTARVPVAGIRVADATGGKLDVSDLTITVDGYASPEDYEAGNAIDTITIKVKTNEQLKQFLTNLQDPNSQTSTGEGIPAGKNSLYWGAGLWQHATVTISGLWYTMSPAEQEAKVFENTVYTNGYKSMDSLDPLKGQSSHRVYSPGEPMYYQWAGHTVYLEKSRLWADVVANSVDESNTLYEQQLGINALGTDASKLVLELTDSQGNPLSAIGDNMYINGYWTTYAAAKAPTAGNKVIYFKNVNHWAQINAYYWAEDNTGMVDSFPGPVMQKVEGEADLYYIEIPEAAENIIFSNAGTSQTADILLPTNDATRISISGDNKVLNVNFTTPGMHRFYVKVTSTDSAVTAKALIPVSFMVTKVKDSTFVLDYGLRTEDLNTSGTLFANDHLLGNQTSTTATLMGITTTQPGYFGTYSAAASKLSNINRIDFAKTAQTRFDADNAADMSVYWAASEGKFFLNNALSDDGTPITFVGNRYTMDKRLWFTPEKFMDEPSVVWLAISVHDADAVNPSAASSVTGDRFHIPGTENTDEVIYTLDIDTEVQMYKKITVLPANVVYYEDDFAGVSYNKTGDNAGSFATHGKGSGSLTQSVNQSQPYGQDKIYQTPDNGLLSGNSMMTINISNTAEKGEFTFAGTGFELISRTNAFNSAAFVVDVYDSGNNLVNRLPVITEYTNVATSCDHSYHNTNGFCTYCGKHVSHSYADGNCSLCGASEAKYYLNGWINDADYQGSDDRFTFKDGRLTVTFEKDSYVYVRDENNVQYWTNGYAGNLATSAMLFEQSALTTADKLRVPGGVEVTFTLVDNGAGAMILSYTTSTTQAGERTLYFDNTAIGWSELYIYYWSEANGQMQIWPGVKMDRIGDTQIYKYVVPADAEQVIFNNGEGGAGNQTGDMLIPGNGYVYNNGVWSEYGNTDTGDMLTLFFDNVDGWQNVYAHYWHYASLTDTSQTMGTTWNGMAMTKVEGTGSLYTIQVPKEMTMVIFNDGTGNQTADLQILGDGCTYRSGTWYDAQNQPITTKRVYFRNLYDGYVPHVWAWVEGGDNVFANWPGGAMTNVVGTDYWYIDLPVDTNRIIFNNNNNGSQTENLLLYGHLTTFADNTWSNVIPTNQSRTVYFENDQLWDEVWAYYYVQDGATFGQFPGVKMERVEGNFYKVQVPNEANMIIFSNNDGTQTADLSLPTGENLYTQGQWKTFVSGAGREICQVPVIRVSDLDYGVYTVKIWGMPTYKDDTDWGNITPEDIKTTYLYIDGIRIFQPMTGNNDNYSDTENGATFVELRNLILDGMAAMAKYDVTLSAFTGSMFWTENRNGKLHNFVTDEDADYFGNRLSSVDDYMVVGPNNEVYLGGNLNNEAVVFYVTEQLQATGLTSENRTVQIAARAIDFGSFASGQSSGTEATLYQGVLIAHPDGSTSYGWNAIDTIQSGTEQYYVIDYASCPYTEENGVKTYQIALYVRSGMVSFTSVKYNGFTITSTGLSEPCNLSYVDGQMMEVSAEGVATPALMTLRLPALSAQMRCATFLSAGEEESEELTQPTLTLGAPSLSFEDEVRYNIYFSATDLEDVVDMGLITFREKLTDGTMADALEVFPGYETDGNRYMVHTGGIAAKNLGDAVYFKVYAKLSDGSYVYSDVAGYNAVAYAKQILKSSDSQQMKALVVSMLNYAAEAQKYLNYKTDELVNSFLTDEQRALVQGYDSSMVDGLIAVDSDKVGSFAYTPEGFAGRRPSVSFNSRFSLNYYFTTAFVPEGQVTMYYWDQAAYEAAEELTVENATGVVFMATGDDSLNFWADVSGIAAKELGESFYVAAVYTDGTNTYSTGVLGYSIDAYCQAMIQCGGAMETLAQSVVVYGDYAKAYFTELAG